MMPALSPNTQAILLLTAPLIAGRGTVSPDLLSPGEYKRLARHLHAMERQPADFLSPEATDLPGACQSIVEADRLRRLLERGLLLSQAIERWQARAIWVVSRADAHYPARLKARLKDNAPAVFYGCGDPGLLESGGLAVVGSRHVDEALIDDTVAVGRLAARARRTLISGGAKGIDQAAMRGALEAGGRVVGVLADSLEKTAMNREHRNLIVDDQLVLVSPYDPGAGFNVGNAMQRNKLIYALADAALVVSSDLNKGGTWSGAKEQLDKLRLVPIYVRSTGAFSEGLAALRDKGAKPWPNPQDAEALAEMLDITVQIPSTVTPTHPCRDAIVHESIPDGTPAVILTERSAPETDQEKLLPAISRRAQSPPDATATECNPADALFRSVRELVRQLLKTQAPMREADVAAALDVSLSQAKAWLQRLDAEGVVEKPRKPAGYILKQSRLFE